MVVAVLLEAFYTARAQYKEEEARIAAAQAREDTAKQLKEEREKSGDPSGVNLQLSPLLERLSDGFDTCGSLIRRIDALFDRCRLSLWLPDRSAFSWVSMTRTTWKRRLTLRLKFGEDKMRDHIIFIMLCLIWLSGYARPRCSP